MATVTRYANLLLTFFVAGVFIHIHPNILELVDPPSIDKPLVTVQSTSASEGELTVRDGAVSDRCWTKLRKAGYVGRVEDNLEALYVTPDKLTTICGKTVTAKVEKAQDDPGSPAGSDGALVAEDGSKVNPHFYDTPPDRSAEAQAARIEKANEKAAARAAGNDQ